MAGIVSGAVLRVVIIIYCLKHLILRFTTNISGYRQSRGLLQNKLAFIYLLSKAQYYINVNLMFLSNCKKPYKICSYVKKLISYLICV